MAPQMLQMLQMQIVSPIRILILNIKIFLFVYAANRQMNVARLIQAVVNAVPMYADVHVEIAPRPNEQSPTLTPASDIAANATATADTAAAATASTTNSTSSNDSLSNSAGATTTNPTVETRGNNSLHFLSYPPESLSSVCLMFF